jgi:hypothetical protein
MDSAFGVEHGDIAKGGINPFKAAKGVAPRGPLGDRLHAERLAAGKKPTKGKFKMQATGRTSRINPR